MSTTERNNNYFASAQAKKRELFSGSTNRVEFSMAETAVAFGISIQNLSVLGKRGCLIVRGKETGAEVSIAPYIVDWRKDLWEEMLKTLKQGRSAKNNYRFLYVLTQATGQEDGESWSQINLPKDFRGKPEFASFWQDLQKGNANLEGNVEFLRQLLVIQWAKLGDGTRNELISQNLGPESVLSSMGIARSGA